MQTSKSVKQAGASGIGCPELLYLNRQLRATGREARHGSRHHLLRGGGVRTTLGNIRLSWVLILKSADTPPTMCRAAAECAMWCARTCARSHTPRAVSSCSPTSSGGPVHAHIEPVAADVRLPAVIESHTPSRSLERSAPSRVGRSGCHQEARVRMPKPSPRCARTLQHPH